jgi:hypothetical protein
MRIVPSALAVLFKKKNLSQRFYWMKQGVNIEPDNNSSPPLMVVSNPLNKRPYPPFRPGVCLFGK